MPVGLLHDRVVRVAFLSALCLLASCGACEKGGSSADDGAHAYVRCMDVPAPEARQGSVGRVRFAVEDRLLTLTAPTPLRLVAFRGAGASTSGLADALLGVREHSPDLVLVLGELGETDAHVRAHLEALDRLGVLVVVLTSGADVAEAVHDAWDDAEPRNVVDGRGLRGIVAGREVLALVSGAPQGRYATDESRCGVSADDFEGVEDALPEGRRWLVSWAAPTGQGPASVSRGFGDVEAGSAPMAQLARALDAKGGIFGFPTTRALSPATSTGEPLAPGQAHAGTRVVVARIAGESDSLHDGARLLPRAALLELSPAGLAYIGESVSSGH